MAFSGSLRNGSEEPVGFGGQKNYKGFGDITTRSKITKTLPGRTVIVIPAKLIKKSSERNKIRRQIREILRKNGGLIDKGVDYTIFFRRNKSPNFKELSEIITRLFKTQNPRRK
ncbi:hypothetical protein C4553_01150 [Candidatus Parcubacteria bacterium]|nr:MAG: hypothetical protein C4553_01150 [Candidatus Parcubacteria bacterium]